MPGREPIGIAWLPGSLLYFLSLSVSIAYLPLPLFLLSYNAS